MSELEAPRKGREAISIVAAGIACVGAIISAMVPAIYSYSGRTKELDVRLVEIGISILRADPKEAQTKGAREWAINVIEAHSGQTFSNEAKQELLQHKLDLRGLDSYGYDGGDYRGGCGTPPAWRTPQSK
jgi:hypothetical protein